MQVATKVRSTAAVLPPRPLPKNVQLPRRIAIARLARSLAPLSISNSPSSRKRVSAAALLGGRFGWLLIRFGFWFFDGLFRLAGLPEFLKQRQLIFGELFAFAAPLRIQQFAQQAPVLVLFRALVLCR